MKKEISQILSHINPLFLYSMKKETINEIFSCIAPVYDVLNTFFSLNLDQYWRNKAVKLTDIKRGDRIIDLCTGTGKIAALCAQAAGQRGEVTGIDNCMKMINKAKDAFPPAKYPQLTFRCEDALCLNCPDEYYDKATISFGIRNIQEIESFLIEVKRILLPGGTFVILEFSRPRGMIFGFFYSLYLSHFLPYIGRIVSKSKDAYRYLEQSINSFHEREYIIELLFKSGFRKARFIELTKGVVTIYIAEK